MTQHIDDQDNTCMTCGSDLSTGRCVPTCVEELKLRAQRKAAAEEQRRAHLRDMVWAAAFALSVSKQEPYSASSSAKHDADEAVSKFDLL